MNTLRQGARGETLAREFLESSGYQFVEANFRRRVGEIDLIMLTPQSDGPPATIVFVEVRFRSSSEFGGAIGSIDWKKQRKMVRVARAWLQKNADSKACARIDVIAIEPDSQTQGSATHHWKGHQIVWIRNAVEEAT